MSSSIKQVCLKHFFLLPKMTKSITIDGANFKYIANKQWDQNN